MKNQLPCWQLLHCGLLVSWPPPAAARDLAVTSAAAKFTTPGVTWGFFCSTPGVAVGRNVSRKRAMEMLLTGDMVDAHQALDWGLVNRVVPAEGLVTETDRLARQLAEKPPVQLAAGKRAFYAQMDLGVAQAYELASGVIAASFAHQEGREGMDAFIEKRDPPGRSRQHRSAASTAKTGTSSVLEPKSWRAPVTSTISLGAGISAAAAAIRRWTRTGRLCRA